MHYDWYESVFAQRGSVQSTESAAQYRVEREVNWIHGDTRTILVRPFRSVMKYSYPYTNGRIFQQSNEVFQRIIIGYMHDMQLDIQRLEVNLRRIALLLILLLTVI